MRGQIVDRGKDGRGRKRWLLRIYLGPDPATGRRVYKSRVFYGPKSAAEAELAKWVAQVEQGGAVEPSRMRVAEFLDKWLEHARVSLSPTTFRRYEEVVRLHLAPALGALPLARLSPLHVQEFVQRKLEAGLSARTVLHIYRILHRALRMATRWRLLVYNPCDGAEPPRPERYQARALGPEELSRLLDACRGTPAYVPVVLAATTGLRAGEILGLEWPDVDLQRRELVVRRAVVRSRTGYVTKAPKSRASSRAVPLLPPAATALREWRAEQAKQRLALGQAWQAGERVCTTPDGRHLAYHSLHWYFQQAVRRAGVAGRLRFHDLRHSYTTALAKQGVHPKVAAALLGHASTTMTLEVYSHVTDAMKREAVERLAEFWGFPRGSR